MSRDKTILPANAPDLLARIEALESQLAKVAASTAPGRSQVNSAIIGQTAHGFAVGNVIRHNGSTWVKSLADTEANAAVGGVVTYVPHPNAFAVAFPGSLVNGLSVSPGMLYVSSTTAGAMSSSPGTVKAPVMMAVSSTSGIVLSGIAAGTGGGTAPTEDGTVFCSNSAGTAGEWTLTIDLGRNVAGKAGKIQILSPNASGVAVEIDAALVTSAARKLTLREIDVCDSGVAKKVMRLESAPY